MIDREARDKLAEGIRALAAGQITNDQFEDGRVNYRSQDPAITGIFDSGAWHLYDDLSEHKLAGQYRLTRDAKAEIARWILFLKTDNEYEWPKSPWYWPLASLLTFGLLSLVRGAWFRRQGDIDVWPFLRRSDYERVLASPPYLSGER